MHRFFSEDVLDSSIQLGPEESRHMAKVLRLQNGDPVECIDGTGKLYECTISNSKKGTLSIHKTHENGESKYGIWIAIAPTKNINRWEWFLEKSCELGIDRISPIISEQSERKILKKERQKKLLIGAIKQSKKTVLPVLDELCTLKEFIKSESEEIKLIAHCREDFIKEDIKNVDFSKHKTLILIGPEGDFSKDEIALATENGFRGVSLSDSRLRTETAGIAACLSLHLLYA